MDTDLVKNTKLLVKGKYEIDFLLQNYAKKPPLSKIHLRLQGFATPERYGDLPAIFPGAFMRSALPFCEIRWEEQEWIEDVDPFLVVGGTFNLYDREEKGTELDEINRLNKLTKNDPKNKNASYFYKVGDLPLYIAQEGKNRVLMFQKHNKPITARIQQQKFPKPHELKIHNILPFNLYALSCTNADFYTRSQKPKEPVALPFPELVLPILENYGVEKGSSIVSFSALYDRYKTRLAATSHLMDS